MTGPITVSDNMLVSLRATRPWVTFISIVWFVGMAISVLFGLAIISGIYSGFNATAMLGRFNKIVGVIYIVLPVLYLMPSLYLYRYAQAIGGLRNSLDAGTFAGALKHQKSFWKYIGIYTIVCLVLYVLFVAGLVIVGTHMAANHHGLP